LKKACKRGAFLLKYFKNQRRYFFRKEVKARKAMSVRLKGGKMESFFYLLSYNFCALRFCRANVMKKQKGQSAVEFALMAPIVFLIIFGMIYGGIMFMDYLNFNNHARTIAREISVAEESERESLVNKYNRYRDELAGVYKVSFNVETDDVDVTVKVDFKRDDSFLMMPKEFAIVYVMKLENNT